MTISIKSPLTTSHQIFCQSTWSIPVPVPLPPHDTVGTHLLAQRKAAEESGVCSWRACHAAQRGYLRFQGRITPHRSMEDGEVMSWHTTLGRERTTAARTKTHSSRHLTPYPKTNVVISSFFALAAPRVRPRRNAMGKQPQSPALVVDSLGWNLATTLTTHTAVWPS